MMKQSGRGVFVSISKANLYPICPTVFGMFLLDLALVVFALDEDVRLASLQNVHHIIAENYLVHSTNKHQTSPSLNLPEYRPPLALFFPNHQVCSQGDYQSIPHLPSLIQMQEMAVMDRIECAVSQYHFQDTVLC